MRLVSALIADYAQVRDGLQFVHAGGITRAVRNSFPCPAPGFLALTVAFDRGEQPDEAVPVDVSLVAEGSEEPHYTLSGLIDSSSGSDGKPFTVSAALTLQDLALPGPGSYSVIIRLAGEVAQSLDFDVLTNQQAQAEAREMEAAESGQD